MNILLASAGRRPYFVRWFKQALVNNGLEGRVIVADIDESAPARSATDTFAVAPQASDEAYGAWLRELLRDQDVQLAISINDFELSVWTALKAQGPDFAALIALDAPTQAIVEDKLKMAGELARQGIPTPCTELASAPSAAALEGDLVVKGRFGSGSRGLCTTTREGLPRAVTRAGDSVTDAAGRRPQSSNAAADMIVVQPLISGDEFGLDVVNDAGGRFVTVLARRKLAMRGGETDKAITVAPGPFMELGESIARLTEHRGLLDVDVLRDATGQLHVIDLNPRFGGGYPFSHMAGADIPSALVAWASDSVAQEAWLHARAGVISSKHVGITATVASSTSDGS